MTDDQPPGRGSGSGRLWTQPREEEEHTQWLARREEAQPPPMSPPAAPEPPPRRLAPLVALATLLACVLFGGGILASNLLGGDGSSGSVAALPAAPGAAAPDARSRTIRDVYARASPSVVFVRSQDGSGSSSGTGFVIDPNGTIVTNAHVVSGASRVQVRFDDNGSGIDAEVLGSDQSSDLAVLRVDASRTQGMKPLVLADSDGVKVGDLAIAIGYPLGLDRTVTAGIISGVGRDIKAPNGFSIDKVIQTDAPINPGNSGGPLLDGAGRVIGVNSQIATAGGSGGNVGIGFAVPSNTVRQIVPRLRSGGSIKRAYLGVTTTASTVGPGARVEEAVIGGPAAQGGVQAGDIVSRVAGQTIQAPEDISSAIENRKPGDRIDIEVQRAGARERLQVTLGTRPENAANANPFSGP